MLRRKEFFTGNPNARGLKDIAFHGCALDSPSFSDPNSGVLAFTIADPAGGEDVHVILNMEDLPLPFALPTIAGRQWFRAVDTVLPPPDTVAAAGGEVLVTTTSYFATPKSVVVLVSKSP
jgi:isoamylase